MHERFTPQEIREYRRTQPGVHVMAHPECPPEVLREADYVGSTSGMIRHIADERPRDVVLITECSMSDNVAVEFPDVDFVRPCNLCPHMKRITLPKILRCLQTLSPAIEVAPDVAGTGAALDGAHAGDRPGIGHHLSAGRGATASPGRNPPDDLQHAE